jgi:peroxiredoxin
MAKMKNDVAAPDFTAQDVAGNTIRLADFRGKKHVVLVFNRGLF